jgi:hypothetical protein
MATKEWRVNDGQKDHVIVLKHGYFSGKREIYLDGKLVDSGQKMMEMGSDYPVPFPGQKSVVVRIYNNVLTYKYDLIVNGISQTTGGYVESIGAIPGWAWIFVVIGVVLVFTGGAIGGALGGGAAFICVTVARNSTMGTFNRVLACLGIMVLAWVGYFVIAGAIVRPMFR